MRQRRLGQTTIEVSELALGTWGLSGGGYAPVSDVDQERVLDRALALGITLFDTADSYGDGAMERKLGQRVPAHDGYFIVTKIGTFKGDKPPRKRFDAAYLRDAVARSCDRLRRDVLGAALLHNPSRDALERGEATSALKMLKEQKKIRLWGVSVSTAAAARAALAEGAELIELPYNIFYSRELHELEAELGEKGASVLAHSVLAYGMLCGKWGSDKEFASDDHRSERWTIDEFHRRIRQLDAVRPLVGGEIHTMRAAALRYVLGNPQVSSAIAGPRNAVQLDQLVREAGKAPPYLPEEKRFALHARLRDLGVNP